MSSAADGWAWPESLDAMSAAAEHHKVLLENERVRVLEAWVAPGETVPVHSHCWPSVLQVLSWSDFVRRDPAGAVLVDSRQAGQALAPGAVLWSGPLPPHSLTNVGSGDLRVLAVELKR
jgi:quercetin dioxygenase-like cupin family protein